MKTYFALALTAVALSAHAQIVNGSFTSLNTGFGSDYTYDASNLYPEGTYTVNSDAHNVHGSWASFGDHTTGNGQMLVVNASGDASKAFWKQSVSLAANTAYTFSFWGASTYPVEAANVVLGVNGVDTGSSLLSLTTGAWTKYTMNFTTGASGTVNLSLRDSNPALYGNDFAIDDISVSRSLSSVPGPASAVVLGVNALAMARRRKRA